MDGGGDAATTIYESAAAKGTDRHDGGIAQQAAELYTITHFLAHSGDDTHGGGLLVYHSDSRFVSYDTGNGAL